MASVRDRFKANKFDVLEKIQRYSIWFILVPSGMLCPISCNALPTISLDRKLPCRNAIGEKRLVSGKPKLLGT